MEYASTTGLLISQRHVQCIPFGKIIIEYLPRKQCGSQFQDHDNSFKASSTYLSSITSFVVLRVLCGVNVCDFLLCCNLTIDLTKKKNEH